MSELNFFYLRNKVAQSQLKESSGNFRGTPIGCIVWRQDKKPGDDKVTITFSTSVCANSDPFKKEIARDLANGRLSANRNMTFGVTANTAGKRVAAIQAILTFISKNSNKFPQRAVNSARQWLKRPAQSKGVKE